jgi:SsrA-binding protein
MQIVNRRARHDYFIFESFEAGIALLGTEVKSIKLGRGDISRAFVRIKDGEAYLVGANIPPFQQQESYDPLRERKLLLHKKEIISIATKTKQQRLTLIPLALYSKGKLIKVKIAYAKGKKQFEKKEAKKRKDIEREIEREIRAKEQL